MCGIAGIFSYGADAPVVDAAALLRTRDHMLRRGPDGEGLWVADNQRVGFAHRRLAIIDLSEAGAQPMASQDGRFRINFNGEIYNYRELQSALQQKGHVFRSTSDTEVLLHLYAEYGQDIVQHLRGMYAFAIWDDTKRGLFLARDPFGIKPLYYYDDGKVFSFASQVKALLESGSIPREPEAAGHTGFLLWGFVPEPYTLYRGLLALPAGSTLWVTAGGPQRPRVFFDIARTLAEAEERPEQRSMHEARELLCAALQDTVSHHLVADVPVGVFLSAGKDSTTLAAHAAQRHSRLRTFTLGFQEYKGTSYDEVPLAESVARHYGTEHTTRWITKAEFRADFDAMLSAMDQPSIDGINTYFVSKAAAETGMKVALSGLGGDELFGGYPSFRQIPKMVSVVGAFPGARVWGAAARMMLSPLLKRITSPKYAGLFEYGGSFGGAYLLRRGLFMPWELDEVMNPCMVREGLEKLDTVPVLESIASSVRRPNLKVTALEATWYMRSQLLRDTDWASMAHSLEVRVPFLDVELLRTVAPLLARDDPATKRDLSSTPLKPLPIAILKRAKTGFAVPVRNWLSSKVEKERGLRGWARRIARHWEFPTLRVVALMSDAFGGVGGIAKFNRDLLRSVAEDPLCQSVDVYPRVIRAELEHIPRKIAYWTDAANGKLSYVRALIPLIQPGKHVDWVICGHVNLVPIAWLIGTLRRCPVTLIVHGIDAWSPHRSLSVRRLITRVDRVVAVSEFTAEKLRSWSGISQDSISILPNCVDLQRFAPRARDPELIERYGLNANRVILTVGRLVSKERYKGFDEVLDALPMLSKEMPDLRYLIVGEGDDRERLQRKAFELGVHDRVIFAGFIPEREKENHYSIADAYVMPSRGEGFGIVFLEAMACGVPTVGSLADGSREALLNGKLGLLVDPSDRVAVADSIRMALNRPRGIPAGLDCFSYPAFAGRVNSIVRQLFP